MWAVAPAFMTCWAAFLCVSCSASLIVSGPKQGRTKWMFGFHGALAWVNASFHLVHFSANCFMWHLLSVLVSVRACVCESRVDYITAGKTNSIKWSRWFLIKELSRYIPRQNNMHFCAALNVFQLRENQTVQQWSQCAYLCLRCGLQVTQPVAQSLSSQAELAILLLDAGHALEHHFIILSRQNRLQSLCLCMRV